jgi:hypothetical protein
VSTQNYRDASVTKFSMRALATRRQLKTSHP